MGAKLVVPLPMGHSEDMVFEPKVSSVSGPDAVVIPDALVNLSSENRILLHVENHTALTVEVEANTVLGLVE